MNENGDNNPLAGRVLIHINVCAQKSQKCTCPGPGTVMPLKAKLKTTKNK